MGRFMHTPPAGSHGDRGRRACSTASNRPRSHGDRQAPRPRRAPRGDDFKTPRMRRLQSSPNRNCIEYLTEHRPRFPFPEGRLQDELRNRSYLFLEVRLEGLEPPRDPAPGSGASRRERGSRWAIQKNVDEDREGLLEGRRNVRISARARGVRRTPERGTRPADRDREEDRTPRERRPSTSRPRPVPGPQALRGDGTRAPPLFGREAEAENVEASLFSTRLTPWGTGRVGSRQGSVLSQASPPRCERRSREDLATGSRPGMRGRRALLVGPDPLTTIAGTGPARPWRIFSAARNFQGPPTDGGTGGSARPLGAQVGGKLLVVSISSRSLPLPRPRERRRDVRLRVSAGGQPGRSAANCLLSIRDDALARLDRFKGRSPSCSRSRLQVTQLGLAAAQTRSSCRSRSQPARRIPPNRSASRRKLVEDVIDVPCALDRYPRESAGAGGLRDGFSGEAQVEVPILQSC